MTRKIPALDGLRGIAILAVYLFHAFGGAYQSSAILRAIKTVTVFGWQGVDLFFVLSGFLISGILMDTRDDPERARSFYVRRALRIFPVFYATAAVLAVAAPLLAIRWPVLAIHWRAGDLAYLFYGANFGAVLEPSLDNPSPYITIGHLWSLAVEEQFYLMWPMVVWRAPRPVLFRICIGIAVLSPLARLLVSPGAAYRLIRWDGFALGAAIAILWRSGGRIRYGIVLLIAGLAGTIAVARITGTSSAQGTPLSASLGISFAELTCTGALICALQSAAAANFLNMRFLRLAGRYSYGFYIFHALWHLPHPVTLACQAVWLGGTTAVNVALAVLSFHFLETPFLRLKDRWSHSAPLQTVRVAPQTASFRE